MQTRIDQNFNLTALKTDLKKDREEVEALRK